MKNTVNRDDFPNFEQFTSSFEANTSFHDANKETRNPFQNIDMDTILKIKQIMEKMNEQKNNPRSNLLLSLKPYLKPSRKQKVDQYIQLFNMENILENLGPTGGEKTK